MASSYVPVDTYKPIAALNDEEPVDIITTQKKNKKNARGSEVFSISSTNKCSERHST